MASASRDTRPYRRGVGIMLVNRHGLVFAARRIDMAEDAWQMPQGGIDEGEAPRAAALRELKEEIGTDKAEIVAESRDWFAYDLPQALSHKAWGGRFRGQTQKWFLCRFMGTNEDIDLNHHHDPEFSEWRWVEAERLPALIVDFKRNLYTAVVEEFSAHLARIRAQARG